jgi:hypothetical protein
MLRNFFICAIFLTLLSSCVPAPPGVDYAPLVRDSKKIAIMPFGLDKNKEDLAVPAGFLTRFNYKLHENLSKSLKSTVVVDINKSYDILRKFDSYDNNFAKFSKQAEADLILTGVISHYTERIGGELGVESPASISFLTRLYDSKTGELLWQYFYTEQQSPLFENLAEVGKFFKRKGKWVTAWELSEEGINVVADRLQNLLEYNANNTSN